MKGGGKTFCFKLSCLEISPLTLVSNFPSHFWCNINSTRMLCQGLPGKSLQSFGGKTESIPETIKLEHRKHYSIMSRQMIKGIDSGAKKGKVPAGVLGAGMQGCDEAGIIGVSHGVSPQTLSRCKQTCLPLRPNLGSFSVQPHFPLGESPGCLFSF